MHPRRLSSVSRLSRLINLKSILAVFAALGVIYSIATPIFEAPDELTHYAVIQHIVDTGELPIQQPGVKTAWEQEGSQPPLYYLLMASIVRLIDTRDAAQRMYRNPHVAPGDPSLDANRNLVIHSSAEDFPWRNTTLAVHLLRFISILMGAATVAIGYALARRLFPEQPSIPIGAALLIALNPMFVFITATVNNDNLNNMLAGLALYLSVACWQEPLVRASRSEWMRRVALGVVLGCAALSKISGLALLPIVALILTIRHGRTRDWRGWVLSGAVIATLVLMIAGWWYVRNQMLYGELLGLNTMVAIIGPRSITLAALVPEFDGFRYSFWALFGAVNIVTFPLAYFIFDAFTVLSLIGCGLWLLSARSRAEPERWWLLLILAGYALLVFIGLIRWTMVTPASQGRLMFPAITVIALMLWLGWETIGRILDSRFQVGGWGKWSMPFFLFVVAVTAPFRDIAPVYAAPSTITADQVPQSIHRLDVDYGQTLRLLGYTLSSDQPSQGMADFTVYWQCLTRPSVDYSVFVIIYGRGLREIGKRDAYPYHGLFATRECHPGDVFADPYRVRLNPAAERPALVRAQIGLKDWAHDTEPAPIVNGRPVSSVMFVAGWLPPDTSAPAPTITARYRLGDAIELLGYDGPSIDNDGRTIHYRLYWHVLNDVTPDYTVFAHLLDKNGVLIGQGDSPPFGGDFPTSYWRAGDTFVEERQIRAANGDASAGSQLEIGLYQLDNGVRLSVLDANGNVMPNGRIVLNLTTEIRGQK